MARSQSRGTLKFVVAAAVAIVGGVAVGYLVGGARPPRSAEQAAPLPPAVVSTPAPSVAPPQARPRVTNGDYTAPGAPRIAIHEESAPVLRRVTPPPVKTDPEATQEAAPPRPDTPKPSATVSAPDAAPSTPAAPADSSAPAPEKAGPSKPPPDTNAPPPAPADPDFERIGKPADPESSQEGGGKAQFRVQTGSYTDESNARSIADELRGKGYATSTRSEREGDHLIYKVQVGAYRTKAGAGKAAGDLQKKGYPAYVSTIGP